MLSYTLHKTGGMPEVSMSTAANTGMAGGTSAKAADGKSAVAGAATAAEAKAGDKLESLLTLDTLQIELGYGLVPMADKAKGGDLLDRVTGVRRTFASDMGVLIPPIRLRDNLQLGQNEYRFVLKGNPIASSQLMPGHWLAMNATNSKVALKGVPTVEPVFNCPRRGSRMSNAKTPKSAVSPWWTRRRCSSRICRKRCAGIATKF